MTRQIKHQNIILKDGKPAVLSTVEIVPGEFETMLASPDFGTEYEVLKARTEAQAFKHFRYLRDNYHRPPLSGKYAQLAEDLKAAAAHGLEVARNTPDGGTCNFDSVSVYLKGWNGKKVRQAAQAAGVACFEWNLWGSRSWCFAARGAGQADANTAAAEAMRDYLKEAGYETGMYYQMD